VPWLLVEQKRKMLADFTVVIRVASVPGTWQNRQLPDVPLSYSNHKRDPRKECCTHYVATLAFGSRPRQGGCKVTGLIVDLGVTSHAPGSAKSVRE
jgi:hypothetical protein